MFNLQRSADSPLKAVIFAITALLASLFIHLTVGAQAPTTLEKVTISVSPQSVDTAVNPGKSTTNVFRITNGSEASLTVQPTPKNFVPRGNEGAIQIEDEETPYSLATWLSVDPSGPVTIKPGQTADFDVTISVPKNADPGGHFGSVVFRTIPSDGEGDTATSVSQEIAPVILVRVPGDANEDATISSFRVPPNGLVTNGDDITFESIVKNNGNVHLKPTGTVSVFNTIGQQVSSIQMDSKNVIPGAERKMDTMWENRGFRIGRYTARVTAVYGNENKIMTAETSFYVFPLKQIIPVVIIVGILIFVLYRMRRRLQLALKILAGKQEGK